MNVQRYTRTAIFFHWLIAFGIMFNVMLAWLWPFLPDEKVRPAIDWHKSIGITLLGLAILRLLWRYAHRPPALPHNYQSWEVTTSKVTHVLLYVIMLGLPLTGWIMDSAWKDAASHPMMLFNQFEWPRIGWIMQLDPATKLRVHDGFGAAHGLLGKLLYVLFFLHVAGAFKHQWIDKDMELQRMWPGRRR